MFPVHIEKLVFGLICVWSTQKSNKVKPKEKKTWHGRGGFQYKGMEKALICKQRKIGLEV